MDIYGLNGGMSYIKTQKLIRNRMVENVTT